MPFAFFSVINQPTLHQYFHVQLYKFKFIYAMHSHFALLNAHVALSRYASTLECVWLWASSRQPIQCSCASLVEIRKFRFLNSYPHYSIKITTLYITLLTYNAVAFISKYTLQTFVCKVYFSCHKVSSHSSSGSLLMTKSGLDGSRTRVQKPFPCSSTIIVSCLNFPQVIEN